MTKKADFGAWAEKFGISPMLARILRNRDLTEESQIQRFLHGTIADCYSPWLLKDMDTAVDVIWQAIGAKKRIRVIGDYDVDGICSSYILTKGLKNLGAAVDTAIPHRVHDGYGLNENLIRLAKEDGVELIVTCDNGISAAEQIKLANELGIDVVVTDHHEVPSIPPARAVVDPKREDCAYPFPEICGAVVALKLVQALTEAALRGESGNGEPSERRKQAGEALEEFIEFAAFATVCDVMPLIDENRILVKEGLKRMKNSRNLGLRSLIAVNELDASKLSGYHLGFVLGPCLNATGRLDTAKRALELLESQNETEAMNAALELKELNDSRKNLTLLGIQRAGDYLESHQTAQDKVLVVYLPEVHESLAGIIAGRVRERYNKPVFVLTKSEDGVKGSGRSIEAYNMFEELTALRELFSVYGGHKMAAGVSMPEQNVDEFRRRINANSRLTEEDFCPVLHIDMALPLSHATEAFAQELELLEPTGTRNARPLFAQKGLVLKKIARMGKNPASNHAKLTVCDAGGCTAEAVLFNRLGELEEFILQKYGKTCLDELLGGRGNCEIALAYRLSVNEYRGIRECRITVESFC